MGMRALMCEEYTFNMGHNRMWFVFSVFVTCVCIYIDAYELCSDQNSTPAVYFCYNSASENLSIIYIGNEKTPMFAKNKFTCTISSSPLLGQVSIGWTHPPDNAKVSVVLHDGTIIAMKINATSRIHIEGDINVIYETTESDLINPFCLYLQASFGTFSARCASPRRFNDTNTSDIRPTATTTTQVSSIEKDLNDTDTRNPTRTTITETTTGSSLEKDLIQHEDNNAVILGPLIGGICALIIVTTAPAFVIVIIIRRRRREHNNTPATGRHIEGGTTDNNTYDVLNHQNTNNNVNTEYCHIANRSGEVNASYENTDI